MPKTLVTGVAGFIGFHTARRLLSRGDIVVGLDNLNDYYSVQLKHDRLKQLLPEARFRFVNFNIADRDPIADLFNREQFDIVVHLAAQPGIRHSLTNPVSCIDANIVGFANIVDACRQARVEHLVYASSSSVYGALQVPFSAHPNTDRPISLYAATKKANELMAHAYTHLFGIATTGLRFFTVYGPWGRPDMAVYKFTHAIFGGHPIDVFNHGHMRRAFTYIDDAVESLMRVLDNPLSATFKIYDIGCEHSIELLELISLLEQRIGRTVKRNYLPMQPGDVPTTAADVEGLARDIGFVPCTSLEEGISRFIDWFREYHDRNPHCRLNSGVK